MNIPNEPYNEVIETLHGKFCIQAKDAFMAKGLRELGECGETETQMLCSLVNPGDCVIDVGANIGLHTIPLAKKITNSGLIFAFEPERINFLNLCANIALNSCYSAYPMNMGAGAEQGMVTLPPIDPWKCDNIGLIDLKKYATSGNGFTVPIEPLDNFNFNPRLIKIDVENMEAEVLRGLHKTIRRCKPYIYAEAWGQNAVDAQVKEITDVKYTGYFFKSYIWRENNFKGVKENNFDDVWSPNMLYVPEGMPVPDGFEFVEIVKTGIKSEEVK